MTIENRRDKLKAFLSIVVVGASLGAALWRGDIGIAIGAWCGWLTLTSLMGMLTEGSTGVSGIHRASMCKIIFLSSLASLGSFAILMAMDGAAKAAHLDNPLADGPLMMVTLCVFVFGGACFIASLILGTNYLFFARESRGWDERFAEKEQQWNNRMGGNDV